MNSEEQSQDFEKLQRLLKLKRYEQPPPRYFNDFSSKVIAHIRADTSVKRFQVADDLISRTPWLRRLWRKLENQPALTGTIATAVCALMVVGVFVMEETPPRNISFPTPGSSSANNDRSADRPEFGENFATTAAAPHLVSSTNPVPLMSPNLFDQIVPGLPGRQPGQPAFISGKPVWQP